jgi:hypothetical protein
MGPRPGNQILLGLLLAGYLLGFLFSHEDGNSMFLRNCGELLPDCRALHPRITATNILYEDLHAFMSVSRT